jgi:hypothetical protein
LGAGGGGSEEQGYSQERNFADRHSFSQVGRTVYGGRGSVKAGNRKWKIGTSKVKSQETSGREQKAAPATARKESGQRVTLEIVEVQVEGKTKPHA